jgi:nucleoside-diphosphate kinase
VPADQRKIATQLTRGNIVAVELVGDDAVSRWHGIMGPADPSDARAAAPASLRALYGRDATANAVYGSATSDEASRELGLVFQDGASFTATYTSCAVCIIKPHAVSSGQLPAILDALVAESGLRLTALRSLQFTREVVEDYLEAYKGVVDEYSRCVGSWVSCACFMADVSMGCVIVGGWLSCLLGTALCWS